jgi:hypothetical protein
MVLILKDKQPKKMLVIWRIYKLNTFLLYSEGTNKKERKQLTEWEKIFVNYTFDKELLSRVLKELLQCHRRKDSLGKTWAKAKKSNKHKVSKTRIVFISGKLQNSDLKKSNN